MTDEMLYAAVLAGGLVLFVLGWLVIVLFGLRRGLFTGILALIPGLNLLYVAHHWSRATPRSGLLISIVGLLIAGVGLYGGGEKKLLAILEPELEVRGIEVPEVKVPITRPTDVEVPNQAEAEAAGVDTTTSVLDRPSEPPPGFEPEPLPPKESQQLITAEVVFDWATTCMPLLKEDLGRRARLSLSEGGIREGRLAGVEDDSIVLAQGVPGGEVQFTYHAWKLTRIDVYAPQLPGPTRAQRCTQLAAEQAAARAAAEAARAAQSAPPAATPEPAPPAPPQPEPAAPAGTQ